jgi:hypothetical protein
MILKSPIPFDSLIRITRKTSNQDITKINVKNTLGERTFDPLLEAFDKSSELSGVKVELGEMAFFHRESKGKKETSSTLNSSISDEPELTENFVSIYFTKSERTIEAYDEEVKVSIEEEKEGRGPLVSNREFYLQTAYIHVNTIEGETFGGDPIQDRDFPYSCVPYPTNIKKRYSIEQCRTFFTGFAQAVFNRLSIVRPDLRGQELALIAIPIYVPKSGRVSTHGGVLFLLLSGLDESHYRLAMAIASQVCYWSACEPDSSLEGEVEFPQLGSRTTAMWFQEPNQGDSSLDCLTGPPHDHLNPNAPISKELIEWLRLHIAELNPLFIQDLLDPTITNQIDLHEAIKKIVGSQAACAANPSVGGLPITYNSMVLLLASCIEVDAYRSNLSLWPSTKGLAQYKRSKLGNGIVWQSKYDQNHIEEYETLNVFHPQQTRQDAGDCVVALLRIFKTFREKGKAQLTSARLTANGLQLEAEGFNLLERVSKWECTLFDVIREMRLVGGSLTENLQKFMRLSSVYGSSIRYPAGRGYGCEIRIEQKRDQILTLEFVTHQSPF